MLPSVLIALKPLEVHRHGVEVIQSSAWIRRSMQLLPMDKNSGYTACIRLGCFSRFLFTLVMSVVLHDVDERLSAMCIPTDL